MRKYINIIIILFILFISRNYIMDLVIDLQSILFRNKPTIIYDDNVVMENIKNLEDELDEMSNILDIKNNYSDLNVIYATVINRDINNWYQFMMIDKGSRDGIKEGMGVITNHGLIGTIYSTSNYSSKVRLLTNNSINNKMSVRIHHNDEYIYCILDSYDKSYILTGISEITDISKGDIVSTSGLGKLPSGIILGFVEEVVMDNYELEKTVYVKPIEGIDKIRYVGIVFKSA